jgi:long-chain acyl-CoA synthetase
LIVLWIFYGWIAHSSFGCISQGQDKSFDLPVKKKSDICTIMYTSGTTGDPKGVLISNESIITLLAGITKLLECCNEQVSSFLLSLLFLAFV